jgi:hypothetical protein
MAAMMSEEVTAVSGPKGKHDANRVAVRHGSEVLGRLAMGKMLAGISTRGWHNGLDPSQPR